jgi:hypothetical protein
LRSFGRRGDTDRDRRGAGADRFFPDCLCTLGEGGAFCRGRFCDCVAVALTGRARADDVAGAGAKSMESAGLFGIDGPDSQLSAVTGGVIAIACGQVASNALAAAVLRLTGRFTDAHPTRSVNRAASGPHVLSSPGATRACVREGCRPDECFCGGRGWGALTNGVIYEGSRGCSTKKTGPMCISIWLLEPCAHGVGLSAAPLAGGSLRRVRHHLYDEVAMPSRSRAEPRAYFFFLAVVLAPSVDRILPV